jgi:hypothetical protein
MGSERFFSRGVNNALSALLGVPSALFIAVSFHNGWWEELTGLWGMGIIGVFY